MCRRYCEVLIILAKSGQSTEYRLHACSTTKLLNSRKTGRPPPRRHRFVAAAAVFSARRRAGAPETRQDNFA